MHRTARKRASQFVDVRNSSQLELQPVMESRLCSLSCKAARPDAHEEFSQHATVSALLRLRNHRVAQPRSFRPFSLAQAYAMSARLARSNAAAMLNSMLTLSQKLDPVF
eukprot:6205349-Pleurochrysis_carterae.AAC.4